MNMDNVFNPSYQWMMNLYQPCGIGINLTNADQMCGMSQVGGGGGPNYDTIQQHLFGSPPFTTGNPPTSFHEGSDRIIYTAMNFCQSPLGNSPFYGTYHAILRPSYVFLRGGGDGGGGVHVDDVCMDAGHSLVHTVTLTYPRTPSRPTR